eukprot:71373_1
MSIPKNIDELSDRIKEEFAAKYSPIQISNFVTNLSQYFSHHQFEEWNDIFDDINNGYNDCCCKNILFEQLNIPVSDIQQRHNEYQRLKLCLTPLISITASFNEIFNDIMKVFTAIFETEIANNILHIFKSVLLKEFEDIETVIDDVEDIESSTIIMYIFDEIDYSKFNQTKQSVQQYIGNGIKYICEHKTDQFMEEYNYQKTKETKTNNIFSEIMKQMNKYLNDTFHTSDNINTPKIVALFNNIVKEEQFDFEMVKDDMDDIESSIILAYISDNMKLTNDTYILEIIRDFVLNYEIIINQRMEDIFSSFLFIDIVGDKGVKRQKFHRIIKHCHFPSFTSTVKNTNTFCKTRYIVIAYIRDLYHTLSNNYIVPQDIISIIIDFSKSNYYISPNQQFSIWNVNIHSNTDIKLEYSKYMQCSDQIKYVVGLILHALWRDKNRLTTKNFEQEQINVIRDYMKSVPTQFDDIENYIAKLKKLKDRYDTLGDKYDWIDDIKLYNSDPRYRAKHAKEIKTCNFNIDLYDIDINNMEQELVNRNAKIDDSSVQMKIKGCGQSIYKEVIGPFETLESLKNVAFKTVNDSISVHRRLGNNFELSKILAMKETKLKKLEIWERNICKFDDGILYNLVKEWYPYLDGFASVNATHYDYSLLGLLQNSVHSYKDVNGDWILCLSFMCSKVHAEKFYLAEMINAKAKAKALYIKKQNK